MAQFYSVHALNRLHHAISDMSQALHVKEVVYPFSTLRVEPGSAALTLVENSDLITGEFDSDWLKFPYAFNDERIAELVKICHDWR